MRSGRVSRTALNVAATMVTLGAKPGWRERLPAGLPEFSEALLLVSGQLPFTDRALRMSRQPWAVRLANLGERLQPGTFQGLGRRKIFMDEQVLAAIDAGAEQVLVLGAGFDTLCLRLAPGHPAISFLELDHPDTGRVKARAVGELGQPDNMRLLAADLGRKNLSAALSECDCWDSSALSVVVAEGLLYYLSHEAVRGLFAELTLCTGRGSRVAFSHLFDPRSYRLARAALRLGGEPWLSASATEALPAYIGPGWRIVDARPGRRFRDLEGLAVAERV
jgi:methyltransferase (TIGR00027 family)